MTSTTGIFFFYFLFFIFFSLLLSSLLPLPFSESLLLALVMFWCSMGVGKIKEKERKKMKFMLIWNCCCIFWDFLSLSLGKIRKIYSFSCFVLFSCLLLHLFICLFVCVFIVPFLLFFQSFYTKTLISIKIIIILIMKLRLSPGFANLQELTNPASLNVVLQKCKAKPTTGLNLPSLRAHTLSICLEYLVSISNNSRALWIIDE